MDKESDLQQKLMELDLMDLQARPDEKASDSSGTGVSDQGRSRGTCFTLESYRIPAARRKMQCSSSLEDTDSNCEVLC